MPTLLQINITANWGSTGKIAESIGLAAMKHGWESYIAYGRWSNPSQSHLIKVGNKLDMYMHYIEQRIRDNEGLCSRRSTRKLIRQIEEIKPDVVQLHNIHDHYLNFKILFDYLNQTNIKVVWTLHDFWPITGHCMHFVSVNCNRYQTGCHHCPMLKVYPKSLMDRSHQNYELKKLLFSANNNLTIVPVSQWVENMSRLSFVKDKPIHVINNGIDTQVFKPTKFLDITRLQDLRNLTDDLFVIISVASEWKFEKGLNDFFDMSTMLSVDEIIVLVGVNDEVIVRLPQNIIGIKRTTNVQDLAALYTRANVVCSFSSAETFGLTIVEGYACGTPAVVYDNTAPPSLITNETGFVVPNKDVKAAYEVIQRIKKIGKSAYANHCIKLAKEKYDKDKCFEEYIRLYESLLQ